MTAKPSDPSAARHVFFDLDGVLVDSRRPIARSINRALQALGARPFEEQRLHGYIGAPLADVFAELLGERGLPASRASECVEHYRQHYAGIYLEQTQPVAGLAAVLASLAPKRQLAVATSKPVEFARPLLERVGLLARFRAVVGPPLETREEKRHTLARALRALGVPAGAPSVLVGDTRFDVEAAHAHGLLCVGVTWGIGSEAELRGAGADVLVASPAELAHCLGANGSGAD